MLKGNHPILRFSGILFYHRGFLGQIYSMQRRDQGNTQICIFCFWIKTCDNTFAICLDLCTYPCFKKKEKKDSILIPNYKMNMQVSKIVLATLSVKFKTKGTISVELWALDLNFKDLVWAIMVSVQLLATAHNRQGVHVHLLFMIQCNTLLVAISHSR